MAISSSRTALLSVPSAVIRPPELPRRESLSASQLALVRDGLLVLVRRMADTPTARCRLRLLLGRLLLQLGAKGRRGAAR
jgi:hypothetical protein